MLWIFVLHFISRISVNLISYWKKILIYFPKYYLFFHMKKSFLYIRLFYEILLRIRSFYSRNTVWKFIRRSQNNITHSSILQRTKLIFSPLKHYIVPNCCFFKKYFEIKIFCITFLLFSMNIILWFRFIALYMKEWEFDGKLKY